MKGLSWLSNDKERVALACSVGVVISLVLGFGGYTQQLFINGILGDANSIYEALTPNGFVQPLNFFEWIASFFFIGHLPLSVLACYWALRKGSMRQVFLRLSLAIFVVLSIVDTGFAIVFEDLRASLGESYLSNFLGSPVIAIIGCLTFLGARKAPEHLPLTRAIANATVPIFIGGVLFLVLFVLVKNLFWVTSSKVSALINPPITGTYSVSAVEKPGVDRFGIFLNTQIPPEKLSWIGKAIHMGLGVGSQKREATVRAYLYEGCPATKTEEILKANPKPFFSAKHVEVTGLGVDDGMIDFSIYSASGDSGYWKASEEPVSMFSINAAKEPKKLDLTLFTSEQVSVQHLGWQEKTVYRADMFAFDDTGLKSRSIAISADGVIQTFTIVPDDAMPVNRGMTCKLLTSRNGSLVSASPLITVLLAISYPPVERFSDFAQTNQTTIKGLNGWLSAKNVGSDDIARYVNAGALRMLSAQGKFDEIFVDEDRQESRHKSWLFLQDGKISGSVEGSSLRIDGVTNVVALDGHRVTKTRWERIALAVKSLIVSIPAALIWLIGVFWQAWKRDEIVVG